MVPYPASGAGQHRPQLIGGELRQRERRGLPVAADGKLGEPSDVVQHTEAASIRAKKVRTRIA